VEGREAEPLSAACSLTYKRGLMYRRALPQRTLRHRFTSNARFALFPGPPLMLAQQSINTAATHHLYDAARNVAQNVVRANMYTRTPFRCTIACWGTRARRTL